MGLSVGYSMFSGIFSFLRLGKGVLRALAGGSKNKNLLRKTLNLSSGKTHYSGY